MYFFKINTLFSGGTLVGIFCIFEHMLVDLLNMLFLPGNLLCYVPPFKKYMIQVFAIDWFGKTHTFHLTQNATSLDLQKQISVKLNIPQSDYWLSGPGGKKMEGNEKLVNLATFHIRGRLLGGTNKWCIRGCTEEASWRKITCLSGVYELKITPDMLSQTNDLPIYICNQHYNYQQRRGHKPKKLYSSVKNAKKLFKKSKGKLERDDSNALIGIKTCSSCQKNIVLTKATPCSKHTLTGSSKSYMRACNCLDETNEGKIQELNSDLYTCSSISNNKEMLPGIDSELLKDFVCTECRPLAYLKLLKAEK